MIETINTTAYPLSKNLDLKKERERLLKLAQKPPHVSLRILPDLEPHPNKQEFVHYFEKEIWPELVMMEQLSVVSGALHVALDRALYESLEEKKQWMEWKDDATKKSQEISTSKEWQQKIRFFAEISEGLGGELAEYARRMKEDLDLGEFTEKELPLLTRLTEISTQISNLSNTSPLVPKLAATEKAVNDAIGAFFKKELGFEDTWKKIESLQGQGRAAHGQDVALKGKELFQEAAVIRTKLAQSKGFTTWAAYIMAQQARHYAANFKTARDKVTFLEKLLEKTEQPYVDFLESRFETVSGLNLQNYRRSQAALIALEDDTLVRDYFPKERIEDTWVRTMLQSGFSTKKIETVTFDGFPRENKYTHAYMSNVFSHQPKVFCVDSETLEVIALGSLDTDWHQAKIFIVQNYRDDGPLAWTTAFHEGGHALDYAYREDLLGYGAAYGYVETHSMTMERFFDDVDYLVAIGETASGTKLSRELAQKYVLHSKMNGLVQMRTQLAYALYDLLLWDCDYTTESETFVDRAVRIFGELIDKATRAKGAVIDGVDWRMSAFASSHFYSGSVRYFGYIVADMAAEMSAVALWERLERTTGRKTFLKQPTMAAELIKGYYRHGFRQPFPASIEAFTEKAFSAENYVQSLIEDVQGYLKHEKNTRTV